VVILAIDQSLKGTGLCVLDNGTLEHSSVIRFETADFANVASILGTILGLIEKYNPQIIVMEDYAYEARGNRFTQLVELGGILKFEFFKLGYLTGHEEILQGNKVLLIQTQSAMKKFCLGDGSTKKDTGYLLKVLQRIKVQFDDDNKADAYMHAYMAGLMYRLLRGEIDIVNLPKEQQEALISRGVRAAKNLSMTKAMKLPSAGKLKLVGY
jgi:hypothetical protein